MDHQISGLKLSIFAFAFGLSGLANAGCEIPASTNAASAQADSGNGNFSCSAFTSKSGMGLVDITSSVPVSGLGPTASWGLQTIGTDGKIWDVDLVSVHSNSGKRCNYTYPDLPMGGSGLTTTNGAADTSTKAVTVCAVPVRVAPPPEQPSPPPELITTIGKNCDAPFTYIGAPDGAAKFDVAIGYSKQFFDENGEYSEEEDAKYEGAAICANGEGKQVGCINECVPHTPTVPPGTPDGTTCADLAATDGSLPISCRTCEYESADSDLKYCWYYENHVYKYSDLFFKPSPKKKSLSASIDVTTGSNCYTITIGPLYGGKMSTVYQCK